MSHSGIPACPTCGERLSGFRLAYRKLREENMDVSEEEKMKLSMTFRNENKISLCCIPHLQQCVELNEILTRS